MAAEEIDATLKEAVAVIQRSRTDLMAAEEMTLTRKEWDGIDATLKEAQRLIQRSKNQKRRWSFFDGFIAGAGTATTLQLVVFLVTRS